MLRQKKAALLLMIWMGLTSGSEDSPPEDLLVENCKSSNAAVEGRILNYTTNKNAYSITSLLIDRVYWGNLRAGDTIQYYSFREEVNRSNRELQNRLVVFLSFRTIDRSSAWATALDFSEFIVTPALQDLLIDCSRKKK